MKLLVFRITLFIFLNTTVFLTQKALGNNYDHLYKNPYIELVQDCQRMDNPNVLMLKLQSNSPLNIRILNNTVVWLDENLQVLSNINSLDTDSLPDGMKVTVRYRLNSSTALESFSFTLQGKRRNIFVDTNFIDIIDHQKLTWSGIIVFRQQHLDNNFHNKYLWQPISNYNNSPSLEEGNYSVYTDNLVMGPNFIKTELMITENSLVIVLSGKKAFNRLVFEDWAKLIIDEGVTMKSGGCNMWGGLSFGNPSSLEIRGTNKNQVCIQDANIGIFVYQDRNLYYHTSFPFEDPFRRGRNYTQPFLRINYANFHNNYFHIYLTSPILAKSFLHNSKFSCTPLKMLAPYEPKSINNTLQLTKTEACLVGFYPRKFESDGMSQPFDDLISRTFTYTLGFFDITNQDLVRENLQRFIIDFPYRFVLPPGIENTRTYGANIKNCSFNDAFYGILAPNLTNLYLPNTFSNISYCGIRYFGDLNITPFANNGANFHGELENEDPNFVGIQNQKIKLSLEEFEENKSPFYYQSKKLNSYWNEINGYIVDDLQPNHLNIAKFGLSVGYLSKVHTGFFEASTKSKVGVFINNFTRESAITIGIVPVKNLTIEDTITSTLFTSPNFLREYLTGIQIGEIRSITNCRFDRLGTGALVYDGLRTIQNNYFNCKTGIFSDGINSSNTFRDTVLTTCNYFGYEPNFSRYGLYFDAGCNPKIFVGEVNYNQMNSSALNRYGGGNVFPVRDDILRSAPINEQEVNLIWTKPINYIPIKSLNLIKPSYAHYFNEFIDEDSSNLNRINIVNRCYTNTYPPTVITDSDNLICSNIAFINDEIYFPIFRGIKPDKPSKPISIVITKEEIVTTEDIRLLPIINKTDSSTGKNISLPLLQNLPKGFYIFIVNNQAIKLILL